MTDQRFRVLPSLDSENEFFWTSGAEGVLRFMCCNDCSLFLHPPIPQCPRCESRRISPRAVSGLGEIHSYTINHQPWDGDPTPYKAFRRAEYVETVGAMDVLPDGASAEQVLAREIVITAEVASMAAHWAAQGALVLGLSDKPDEASLPTPEHAASGWQPLHRAVMKVYGQYLA